MSKPVNLNRFRKEKARAEKKARADQNAIVHGLPKSAKDAARKLNAQASATLDGKASGKDKLK